MRACDFSHESSSFWEVYVYYVSAFMIMRGCMGLGEQIIVSAAMIMLNVLDLLLQLHFWLSCKGRY